jgi:mannose-6-phosphate isomerase-like protein (cupin superfamily)
MSSDLVIHGFCSALGEGQLLPTRGRLKVSSAQSGGALEVIELGPGSPPPHIHYAHEECFYIIEGVYTFTVGTEQLEAPAGSVVFVPRGTRHAFRRGENARALVFVTPAGLEGFFRELGEGLAAGRSEVELRSELAGKYDSQPVSPAL